MSTLPGLCPVAVMSRDSTTSYHGWTGFTAVMNTTMLGRVKAANTGATRRVRLWPPSSGRVASGAVLDLNGAFYLR